MTFTNVALSLIAVAILALIPCGCFSPGHRISNRTNRWHTRRRASPRCAETSALVLPHLHARIAILERLIPDETNRYAGRKARDRASARPNNEVSVRRALAGIRIGMRWRAILRNGWLGF